MNDNKNSIEDAVKELIRNRNPRNRYTGTYKTETFYDLEGMSRYEHKSREGKDSYFNCGVAYTHSSICCDDYLEHIDVCPRCKTIEDDSDRDRTWGMYHHFINLETWTNSGRVLKVEYMSTDININDDKEDEE